MARESNQFELGKWVKQQHQFFTQQHQFFTFFGSRYRHFSGVGRWSVNWQISPDGFQNLAHYVSSLLLTISWQCGTSAPCLLCQLAPSIGRIQLTTVCPIELLQFLLTFFRGFDGLDNKSPADESISSAALLLNRIPSYPTPAIGGTQ